MDGRRLAAVVTPEGWSGDDVGVEARTGTVWARVVDHTGAEIRCAGTVNNRTEMHLFPEIAEHIAANTVRLLALGVAGGDVAVQDDAQELQCILQVTK